MAKAGNGKWEAREALRSKGQFWTPQWVARPMVRYALGEGAAIFDPGVGAGAFARAMADLRPDLRLREVFSGCEIDPSALEQGKVNRLSGDDFAGVLHQDFLSLQELPRRAGIVSNPPYIRHHRISASEKERLKCLARDATGVEIDGRAGLHVYFFIHALSLLTQGQKLAFIMPSDIAEGVFAGALWRWISARFRIEAVVRFTPKATPFPNVDTNPVLFFISHQSPLAKITQITCTDPNTPDLEDWLASGMPKTVKGSLLISEVPLEQAVAGGVTRSYDAELQRSTPLRAFAKTLRGIATGANDFFFMTKAQIDETGIPEKFFIRAIGRTRDVQTSIVTRADLDRLESEGKPTWLLALDGTSTDELPDRVKRYLAAGEREGLSERALISTRNPWYRMETRIPPRFLFAYLGRRNARFISNDAGIVPLTGFLCVYPKNEDPRFHASLWKALQDPRTLEGLKLVGKSYGGGAIKVEPRSLENLPIPEGVLKESGLFEWAHESTVSVGFHQDTLLDFVV